MTVHLHLDGNISIHFTPIHQENQEQPIIRFFLQHDLTEIDLPSILSCLIIQVNGDVNSAFMHLNPNVQALFLFPLPMQKILSDTEFQRMSTVPIMDGLMLLLSMHLLRSEEVKLFQLY